MTSAQTHTARHAPGLPNPGRMSYRNRFVCGPGHEDYDTWIGMCARGLATRRDGKTLPFSGDDQFWLTRKGAEAALEPGERLDAEDFPA